MYFVFYVMSILFVEPLHVIVNYLRI